MRSVMDELLQSVFEAGVVGCGGAGFPTHVKLNCKPEYLLVNGVECEPMLRTDRHVMLAHAEELVEAAGNIAVRLGNPRCIFVLKDSYKEEIRSLNAAISAKGAKIELCLASSFYPAGDEQAVVFEATGRVVPPAGLPLDVGCVVINAATLFAVGNAVRGQAFIHKYLTVSGAVHAPSVLCVPVGTSFADCIAACGGATVKEYIIIAGGPLMGRRMTAGEAAGECVGKTTSGILLLPAEKAGLRRFSLEQMKNRARASCIQCTYCTELCPRHLLGHPIEPHKIMRKLSYASDIEALLTEPEIANALLCCECGVCEIYACPMGLQPRSVNAYLRKELAKKGIRYSKGAGQTPVSEDREYRKTPSRRIAERAGVGEYYSVCKADDCIAVNPQVVRLLLKQGAGSPSQPVIQSGERVKEGQLIAKCPEGALGANLHASISGIATVSADSIRIVGDQ